MKKGRGGNEVTARVMAAVDSTSPASSFRELDHASLQRQAKIWLGEVLHVRFDEETSMADLIADGELLFQVSKLIWKMLVKKHKDLKSKLHIYERASSSKSEGKYSPYPKVDSFLKVCQILGLTGIDLFSPSDVVERRDTRRVCMCIRSLSIKARSKNLDVPDFDVVTYTITMPNYVVGGICRSLLEQSRCSSSRSSVSSVGSYRQELQYDSDEAESCLTEAECDTPISQDQSDHTHLFDLDGELLEESVDDKRLPLSCEEHYPENCETSINSPEASKIFMDRSNSGVSIPNENSDDVVSGVNHASLSCDSCLSYEQDGDFTPESKLATSEKIQENLTEDSGTRISDAESCVAMELDDEFELEKSEDNFTQELGTDSIEPLSDYTEETRLLRESAVLDLNDEVLCSHFEENVESSNFAISKSLTTESIHENTLDSTEYVDPSTERTSTSREIEAGDELEECEKVMKASEHTVRTPVKLCENAKKPKEVKHSGHKVIASVAGGITAVGFLLVFLQLRKRSNERNHVIILGSKIDKENDNNDTVKRDVPIQKQNVYPAKWLKI